MQIDNDCIGNCWVVLLKIWHLGNIKVDFTNYTVLLELDVILQLLLQSV